MTNEVSEQVEDLRLDRNLFLAAMQLAAIHVERTVVEKVTQSRSARGNETEATLTRRFLRKNGGKLEMPREARRAILYQPAG
ncbi:hypothetical protein RSO01_40280 [Reyranella soli]|uniref:Uncharacterized protein n=1 Tax=Reyranella soli TaxID=1230389 RepID=A0A512ND46_9HYPH|nr:hypothetical protein RSO01_40280 [Reyranella soli]